MSTILFLLLTFTSGVIRTNSLETNPPSIVIVGAGPSGIAAATRLINHNLTNIKILEAEGRIGGRIRSVKFGESHVDLGAEWCHGEKDNIVYGMIKDYNILVHTNLTYRLVYSNGQYIDEDIYQDLIAFAESVDASQTNSLTEEYCENVASIGECFDKMYNTTFSRKYQNETNKLKITLEAADWLESYMLGYDSTFTLNDLSRKSDYKRCEGDLRLNWNGHGYKTILDLMLQKFPDPSRELQIADKLYLNKQVDKIIWDTKSLIHCSDNTSYQADHVVFTPSLGVLKAQHESLFEPKLSNEKIKAIRNFGFGSVFKIALHFPQPWWDSKELYGFVWSSEDESNIATEYPSGPTKNGRSWLTYSVKFFQAENNSKVLMGFFAGDIVPELEKEPDKVIIGGIMYMLRKFLGEKYSIMEPDHIIRSSWYTNPHFRGTYSYESVKGNSSGSRYPRSLAEPLELKGKLSVLFAGEATHPYYFSTVHGAIESGYREADRLIEVYGKNNITST